MALSWNEIKDRALRFSKEWEGESRERAEKDSFWNDFFNVFGISRRRVATFEEPIKKLSNNTGFIDLFWEGTLLVEHKSKGQNLDAAYTQAKDYFHGLEEHELPKYVMVSDFERFRLYDLDEKSSHEFVLSDFHKHVKLFAFIAGYQKRTFRDQDPVNVKAAELLGKLHDKLKDSGYEGHKLEIFLVRILFCLFADDTGIFQKDLFRDLIENRTRVDGSDLGGWLSQFFQTLNTPQDSRMKNLDEDLDAFPYVNGKLFEEALPIPAFDSSMREMLIKCSALDWGQISPAIFGSMFQSVMNPEERRNLGAHYTSEKNIMKLIKPLFLDELQKEFKKVKSNRNKLLAFHEKLGRLKFLDPACGCGNFLIITYRELRRLELETLKILQGSQQVFDIDALMKVDVDQFYGIEYEEFPARIAEVAMWLMDHQMNLQVSEAFGLYYARLPLRNSANIVHGNALQIPWEEAVPHEELSFILGNPPFLGHHYQSKEQKAELQEVLEDVKASGVMDYVSGWYFLAAKYIQGTQIKVGFVSTNSIAQGEQVNILWDPLLNIFGIKIHFAHRTFAWNNEARGKAAVHCVIIGFANFDVKNKILFDYEDIKGDPHEIKVNNINPYLVDADDILVYNRSKPLCDVPEMKYGSKPTDGGFFILTDEEKNRFIKEDPKTKKVIKPFLSAREYLNGGKRWVIWLVGVSSKDIKSMPLILDRVQKVKEFRAASKAKSTREYPYHTLFRQVTQPDSDFILVPRVSSEKRKYVPMGFFTKENIVSDSCQAIPDGTLLEFGVLMSEMHMAWLRYTCGRLESRFRYSKDIVYNNFPWPENPSEANVQKVKEKAQKVLDIREEFKDSNLADLYDPLTMPPKLVKAHKELDRAVDICYRRQKFPNEASRVEYLFGLYAKYLEQEQN